MLTHFLLDGHHKLEAAATTQRPVRLLSLVSIDSSQAQREHVEQIPTLRAHPAKTRTVHTRPPDTGTR